MSMRSFTRPGLTSAATLVVASFMSVQSASAASARAYVDGDVLIVHAAVATTGSRCVSRRVRRTRCRSTSVTTARPSTASTARRSARSSCSLLGGDDQFRVDQVNGAFADEAITVDGGSGDDTMNGGDGVEIFLGGGGSRLRRRQPRRRHRLLEGGNDTFRWDPGDGSDVVEGGGGTDTLDFNGAAGAENMSLSAVGSRSLFLRDAGNIRMDMNDVELLDLTALGGVDTFTLNDMRGTGFLRADVDLSASAATPTAPPTS